MKKNYLHSIVKHYEDCLEKFGDSHLGVDWPKPEDVNNRYSVMLELQKFDRRPNISNPSVLDFGCGTAHLLEYMNRNGYENWTYCGLDISSKFIAVCNEKFPDTKFYCTDILTNRRSIDAVDYMVMNGVFTEKRDLSFDEMFEYFTRMLKKVFPIAHRGVAFNTMSKAVDWERDDLFHLPIDLLVSFLTKNVTRNFIIRNDYGLYEYTTYIYH